MKVHNKNVQIESTVLEHWQIYTGSGVKKVKDDFTLSMVFSITNYCDDGGNVNIRRKSYIFVQKKVKEIKEIIEYNKKEKENKKEKRDLYKYLINEKDKVKILGADFTITDIEFDEIRQEQLMSIHNHHDHNGDDKDYVY